MKVLDLQCQHAHSFEGWFGSEDDFQSQLARGLVECPMCGDARIIKKLSAPRLNLLSTRAEARSDNVSPAASPSAGAVAKVPESASTHAHDNALANTLANTLGNAPHAAMPAAMHTMLQDPQFQAAYLQMTRTLMAQTEDVGNQFAEEARKMHYGEADERAIRGQATQDEALELLDEGIDVMQLPLPKALKESLQ
jgi:hypothetical protein